MVCSTKTRDGTSSPTAGSANQEHRILPQSVPDIVQSLQERNVILWLKIYLVVDEQNCKAELTLGLFYQPVKHAWTPWEAEQSSQRDTLL